jgi:hypothetical protein
MKYLWKGLQVIGGVVTGLWGLFIALDARMVNKAETVVAPIEREFNSHKKYVENDLNRIQTRQDDTYRLMLEIAQKK